MAVECSFVAMYKEGCEHPSYGSYLSFSKHHRIMNVTVELFGIPRARAGVATTTATGASLGDVLADLARRFPDLAETCIDDRRLKPGTMASLAGDRFVTDPDTRLEEGACLLILSADAGG